MDINKNDKVNSLNFYSKEMIISKKSLVEHHLKLTYQRQLISNLDLKHKNWSKHIGY